MTSQDLLPQNEFAPVDVLQQAVAAGLAPALIEVHEALVASGKAKPRKARKAK